ncbi:hypothetical protein Scep_004416 [Stephania cephalantha]|uniref:Uncharacterized protein n=1 Tax=Stephania cephalantha TaxID=152367 RepID=A0AAP0KSE7_9MAGN
MSIIVLFFLSATPFCCSVCGGMISCLIPWRSQNFENVEDVYSPPPSVLKVLM